MDTKFFLTVICALTLASYVCGHARLIEPPGRSTLFRYVDINPLITPYKSIVKANYMDHALYCGGFSHQKRLDMKCGVCGDAYDGVKENEAGGKYGLGIIVKQYPQGADIIAEVEVTAHHKGYFEFRLCPWNDPSTPVTQQCLDQYPLESEDGTRWMLPNRGSGIYKVPLKLPDGLECDQCVLQWKYHAGNSWGCNNDAEKQCCVGCGPQEEFYACADIAIGDGEVYPPPQFRTDTDTKPPSTTTATPVATNPVSTTTTTAPPIISSVKPQPPSPVQPVDSGSCATITTTTTTRTVGSSLSTEVCQIYETGIKVKDCNSFYMCVRGTAYDFTCPKDTVFNAEFNVCDHPCDVSPPCGTKK